MNRVVLSILLVALPCFQHFVMERTPEKREEERFTRIADLPASSALPAYLTSLFLGSFRAVAVDVMWIRLKKIQEERRYLEAKEILEMISYLQPRNEEVWAFLGWDTAYNMAAGARDNDEKWKWIRYGLLKIHEGIRQNPNSSYLKSELARHLWFKFSWKDGWLDTDMLHRLEGDDELQRSLQGITRLERRMSAFELSIRYYDATRAQLEAEGRKGEHGRFELSQMGLYLYPHSMDGFAARECAYKQALWMWLKASPEHPETYEEVKRWFRIAAERIDHCIRKYDIFRINSLWRRIETFYRRMVEIVDLNDKMERERTRESVQTFVDRLETLMLEVGNLDYSYVTGRPGGILSRAKRALTMDPQIFREGDMAEFNDAPSFAWPLQKGILLSANLGPRESDRDYYEVPPVHREGREPERRTLSFRVGREGDCDLKVTLTDITGKVLAQFQVTDPAMRDLQCDVDPLDAVFILIEAATRPLPRNTCYTLQWVGAK